MQLFKKEKKGVASLYVVVFATILFGVITLSFTKIVISELDQTSKDDLSRSAYDSALAGVEDAKYYVNKYYTCVRNHGTNCDSEWNIFTNFRNTSVHTCENGFKLSFKKNHITTGYKEVMIGQNEFGDQAYTCVLASDIVPDYRSRLTSDTRTKVVPLNVGGNIGSSASITGTTFTSGTDISKADEIVFQWFSQADQGAEGFQHLNDGMNGDRILPKKSGRPIPPVIQLSFIRTAGNINLSDFKSANNENDTIYSTIVLRPVDAGGANVMSWAELKRNGNAYNTSDNSESHEPVKVNCTEGSEFACTFTMKVDGELRSTDNVFLVVSMPYGDAYSDFKIAAQQVIPGTGGTAEQRIGLDFKGVQVSVDSTGRTNQLYRRVEARLDAADLFFPFPQYAAELSGTGNDDGIIKDFWVTTNCWTERGACDFDSDGNSENTGPASTSTVTPGGSI